jgi:hypothetical protein
VRYLPACEAHAEQGDERLRDVRDGFPLMVQAGL